MQAKNCSYHNSTVKLRFWKRQEYEDLWYQIFFKFYGSWKNLRFYSSNITCRQYWSNEQICLELKAWMSSFLNVRSSLPEVSCKKMFLKMLQSSLKTFRAAVFTLIEFQALKICNFMEKRLQHICFPKNSAKVFRNLFCRTPADSYFWNIF